METTILFRNRRMLSKLIKFGFLYKNCFLKIEDEENREKNNINRGKKNRQMTRVTHITNMVRQPHVRQCTNTQIKCTRALAHLHTSGCTSMI